MVYFDGTVAFRMWAICRQGVLLIEQNSNIACPEFAIDRCALTSELQALADETMGEFEGPEPLHYACLLDMDQVYRLFDRRCRTEAALEKLAKLRYRVRRFKNLGQVLKKLFTPNIEKALTFLDDSLLPSTSNAVERGYRRYRKMQKSVYRVRTQEHINQRIALDMQREQQARGRLQTITTLHSERSKAA